MGQRGFDRTRDLLKHHAGTRMRGMNEDLLHDHGVRQIRLKPPFDRFEQFPDSTGPAVTGRTPVAHLNDPDAVRSGFDNGHARGATSGVDAQDDHVLCRVHFCQELIGEFEVGPDPLHVIVVFEGFHKAEDFFCRFKVRFDLILGYHDQF